MEEAYEHNEAQPVADGSSDAAQATSYGLTAEEVDSIVQSRLTAALAGTEGNILTTLGARVSDGDGRVIGTLSANLDQTEQRIVSNITDAVLASTSGQQVGSLTMEQVLAYVPEGGPTFVGSFITPLLWGIGAGFVVWLIGHSWASLMALLGLAGDK